MSWPYDGYSQYYCEDCGWTWESDCEEFECPMCDSWAIQETEGEDE